MRAAARVPEWSKGADLSSAGESLMGSNPIACIKLGNKQQKKICRINRFPACMKIEQQKIIKLMRK